jgi:hypothetical protein
MAGKEPTVGQPYRAGDTTPTPWAEACERLADADTYCGAKQLPFAPVRSHPRIAADTKKTGAEGRSCSGLMRGRQEKDLNSTRVAGIRPRSVCSIAILPGRCKESLRRPAREGRGPTWTGAIGGFRKHTLSAIR